MPVLERLLPLFPLNVVLFPGAPLPLHVFEERYKLMVQRCLDSDSRFGVVLIRSGMEVGEPAEPHDVGTLASIANVRDLDDGRMLLNNIGERRFRILKVTESRPYIQGSVELLYDQVPTELDSDLKERTRTLMTDQLRLLLGSRGGWVKDPDLPHDLTALSYFVCSSLQAGPAEKQILLEEDSPEERLRGALDLVERDLPSLRDHVAEEMTRRAGLQ